jgi:hypothetical protein
MKRRLAEMAGTDASRYSTELGTERHKRLSAADIDGICEQLGLGFLCAETMQEQRDAIMIKLDRDHRTGARSWDSSDLLAVVEALEEVTDGVE